MHPWGEGDVDGWCQQVLGIDQPLWEKDRGTPAGGRGGNGQAASMMQMESGGPILGGPGARVGSRSRVWCSWLWVTRCTRTGARVHALVCGHSPWPGGGEHNE